MKPLLFSLPGNEQFAAGLAALLDADVGALSTRHFPDGETYIRLDSDVVTRSVILVCTLDRPDDKALRLLFAADAARDLGAVSVGLVAPYLAYMRQDRRFLPGEAVTSQFFARLLSAHFDWMVTVDPHLHRRSSMAEIYSIPVGVCHAAPRISAWIGANVANPIIIGPDVESEQWVSAVASGAGAPFTTLEKKRRGDREVEITVRDIVEWRDRQPVLVDDIISSGGTMEMVVGQLISQGFSAPVIVAVHGLFAEDAFERLRTAGAGLIVSTNTVPHAASAIDVCEVVHGAVSQRLTASPTRYR